MARTQENRIAAVESPLGTDVLLLKSCQWSEQLGRPFEGQLDLLCEDLAVDFSKIVGQNVTLRLETGAGETRYFNGFVSRFVQLAPHGRLAQYRATLVPWLWFLTRSADCRIFQNKNVPDIIKEIFEGRGFTDIVNSLHGTYGPWEYCVQYRETDFNFVSRLMEQEGIYYHFKHESGKHSIVLVDDPSALQPHPSYEQIAYRPVTGDANIESILEWTVEQELQPGAYALNDYHFKSPRKALRSAAQVKREHTAADFEIYDYPGEYEETGDGDDYAKIRIQELQAQHEVIHASSDAMGICTGCTFALSDHPREDQNREYLVTSATYQFTSDQMDSGNGTGGEGPVFSCNFTAMDAKTPFRAPRLTPKPLIQGPQTAIVVGPAGQEIHTDEHGRVKVQFHWDRYGVADENSSCWIRVAQIWAGKKWGGMFIPRIGQEVIVDFLEGDPDSPIVTGRVYNGDNKTPYDLPAHKTISGVKSNSSIGGAGFNEIRFEDKKGEEQIFIHGEKNQDIRIKNDCFEWIGHDRHLIVKNMQFEHIEVDRHETIDRDHQEKIGRDRHTIINGKEARQVDKTFSLKVTGNVAEVFEANHSEQVTNDYYLKADNIVIEGMTNVTIKVGQSYIAIEAGGIKIGTTGTIELESTATTSIKATAPLTIESQATAEMKSPMTTVKGDGMLTLKGGMTMIN